jgi:hypothetical protein
MSISRSPRYTDVPEELANNMRKIKRQLPQLIFQHQPKHKTKGKQDRTVMPSNFSGIMNSNVTINNIIFHVTQMAQTMLPKFIKITEGY